MVHCQPFQLETEGDQQLEPVVAEVDDVVDLVAIPEHTREKRATCDLLSPFKVGHAACAAHCIARGKRGGWCDKRAVCNCRK
uniref:Defensin-like peptide 4 n=2 Tax=Hermetia illucens TaxID=343691 RepID=W5U4X3_HERIL|nr:defensin-like peptide 4 precursor [Hermetia illucens]BDU59536.1 defensin-like peptide 4 precursor [Hermetia illucens]